MTLTWEARLWKAVKSSLSFLASYDGTMWSLLLVSSSRRAVTMHADMTTNAHVPTVQEKGMHDWVLMAVAEVGVDLVFWMSVHDLFSRMVR